MIDTPNRPEGAQARERLQDALVELQSAAWSRSWKRVKAARAVVKALTGLDVPGPLTHALAKDASPAQAEQEDRCVAEEWHRDGRGLWAMRRCTLPPKHSEGHTYLAWRYRVDPPSYGVQAEQEIARLQCKTHGDPLVCLACEAEEDARPEWKAPHRVTPPRLRGEAPVEWDRLVAQAHAISETLHFAGAQSGTLHEGVTALVEQRDRAEQEIATLKAELAKAQTEARYDIGAMNEILLASEQRADAAEQARAALRALVEKWREEVHTRAGQGCGCYGRSTQLRICADELDAVLRSPVERTREEENDLARQSSASEAPDLGISAIPTRKAPGDD